MQYRWAMTTAVRATAEVYDLEALVQDLATARKILDFGHGTFGHSISLPAPGQLAADHRAHRNNVPGADALDHCPAFRAIFDAFQTEKAGFRLLRRAPGSAYSLHDDRDAGDDVLRMQIPIITNDASVLLFQKDGAELEPLARQVAKFEGDGGLHTAFDFARLQDLFGEWLDAFVLEPGYFYRFDTDRIHTVINAGTTERIVLCVDLIRVDWVEQWMQEHLIRDVAPMAIDTFPTGRWDWGGLRHGLLSHPRIQLT
jgi:hypothetical protein